MTGLRGYQGEFTFSGLEEHLFSELRRFRTAGKDELLERDLVKLSSSLSLHSWKTDLAEDNFEIDLNKCNSDISKKF